MKLQKDSCNIIRLEDQRVKAEENIEIFQNFEMCVKNYPNWEDRKIFIEDLIAFKSPNLIEEIKTQQIPERNVIRSENQIHVHKATNSPFESNFTNNSNDKDEDDDEINEDDISFNMDKSPREVKGNDRISNVKSNIFNRDEIETDQEDDEIKIIKQKKKKQLIEENEGLKHVIDSMEEDKFLLNRKIKKYKKKIKKQSNLLKSSMRIDELVFNNRLHHENRDLFHLLEKKDSQIQKLRQNLEKLERRHKVFVNRDQLDEEIRNADVANEAHNFLETTISKVFTPDLKSSLYRSQVKAKNFEQPVRDIDPSINEEIKSINIPSNYY